MLSAKLLIPAVAGLALVAFAGGKQAAAKSGDKPGAQSVPPPDLMAKIAAAFQAADPGQCRALADEVERAGFKAQADDLRAFAKKVEDAIKATPATKPPAQATLPPSVPGAVPSPQPPLAPQTAVPAGFPPAPAGVPVTVLPEIVERAGPTAAQRMLAGKTALMLSKSAKGREDQSLVTAFQQQAIDLNQPPGGAFGSVPSKADGKYGPKSALQLARHYGIVPPKPFYWSKTNWHADKLAYRAEMAKLAGVDPQRADEWLNAGKVL